MSYRRNFTAMTVVILGLLIFVPAAQAERQEWEGISCFSTTNTPLQASPGEIYSGSFEGKGIFRATSKPYYETTFRFVGVVKGQGGKWTWNGFTKSMTSDGDFIIWEFSGDSAGGSAPAKIIYGTGKYKGAKGEQTVTRITKGKPIVEGTEQACEKIVGWTELAK
jgi:hypothetical protein